MRSLIPLAAAMLTAAIPAFATPQSRSATDLWFNVNESGWGLNLIHQGDTVFASLFVYGPDGQPKWYYASGLAGDGSSYSGALYENTGPWFGGRFDGGPVSARQVGTLALSIGDNGGGLDYTIDGVHVTKAISRYTFRRTTLQGSYDGYMLQPAGSGGAEAGRTDLSLLVSDNGTSFSMDTESDSQSPCKYNGTLGQDGQLEGVAGTFQCFSGTGPWSMTVDPTPEGFTGTFSGNGINGRIAAARRGAAQMQGNGWRNDLWYVPNESGWGLNVIEQGDTLFASLFVYDAQNRPRWYSASDLRQAGDSASGDVTYTGALVESTGPYFGTSFNPSAVTRRTVGAMTFRTQADGVNAELSYSVDGVQVVKTVMRYTFRKEDFSGAYTGSYAHDRQATFTIDDSGTNFQMQMVDRFGGLGTCNFVAPFSQAGLQRAMDGTFSCSGGRTGSFSMRNATVSAQGFTARIDAPALSADLVGGHIAGVRR